MRALRIPLLLLLASTLSVACFGPSGTSVFDVTGTRVGRVSVQDEDSATIFDAAGNREGRVSDDRVLNRAGSRVGRITSDDRILDSSGTRVGRVSGETSCLDRSGTRVGRIAEDIDDEAAGGACLLLLLLP